MNQEIKSIVKKTVKVAGATCFALGGAALIASGAALKALVEGARYLKDTVQQIVRDEPAEENTIVDAVTEETSAEAQEAPEEVAPAEAEPLEA